MNEVVAHFSARAAHYDRSSTWCTDDTLAARVVAAVAPEPHHRLLDVACGTGLVSRRFVGKVAHITGVDLTPEMFAQARPFVDHLVEADATRLPFEDASFDRVVCRQGIQFMDDARAVAEMLRVVRPGGRVVLVHLAAYGEADRADTFEVLRLRNPARRNFYLREDLERLLRAGGAAEVTLEDARVVEDVEAWADNRAIDDHRVRAVSDAYRAANGAFLRSHEVRFVDGRILDTMLMVIATGVRASGS